jgi:membrane peptidoglycan carboxypeptidase
VDTTAEEPVETRPPAGRWRRVTARMALLVLLWTAAGAGAAEAYVDAVPLPGDPSAPQASVLYYRDGTTILARVGVTDHSDVPLSTVPEAVRRAVMAAEDRDFDDHLGVSVRGVFRAAVARTEGGSQGASTITQQYVRNAFLTQEFSVDRKAKEIALAIKLERQYAKDEILARYLNTIYYGRGAYGIAAAAHAYFGISADRLTLAQGAVLAAVIKDPWHFDPAVSAKDARTRWWWIINAARQQGWIAVLPAYPRVLPRSAESEALAGPNGLVVDQVERELSAHGVTPQALHTKGLAVVTTLDATAQAAALDLVRTTLRKQPKGLRSALVAVDPPTGAVRAWSGGDRGRGSVDDAALAAAMRDGIGYLSRWDGSSPRVFPDRGGVPLVNHDDLQCPNCTLEKAMVQSLNTPFYAITEQIGAARVRDMAIDLGVSARYDGRPSLVDAKGDPRPGRTRADIALGRYAVSPADLASTYATFAAGGVHSARHFVVSATAADRRVLWTAAPVRTPVLDRGAAADVSTVLRAVVDDDGTAPGRPAAGKSGTQAWGDSDDTQNAWMVGYTPQLSAAVWIGRSVPGPIRTATGTPIRGETLPAQMWRTFLTTALAGQAAVPFPAAAHVGRTDVGDAGRRHGPSPDGLPGKGARATGHQPVVHTAKSGRYLALTFDDGPSAYTGEVLDLLKKHHVTAVFCVVGENVEDHPAMLRRIVAEGHGLCNHSTRHDALGKASAATIRADIAGTDAAIAAAVPGATVPWFRAPYGDWGLSSEVGADLGHTPLGWVVDPDDWLLPGAGIIADRIEDQLTPRAVVLVHDGGGDRRQTIDALSTLIPRLKKKGWSFDLPERTVSARPLENAQPSATPSPSPTPTPTPTPSATSTAPPQPSTPDELGGGEPAQVDAG